MFKELADDNSFHPFFSDEENTSFGFDSDDDTSVSNKASTKTNTAAELDKKA